MAPDGVGARDAAAGELELRARDVEAVQLDVACKGAATCGYVGRKRRQNHAGGAACDARRRSEPPVNFEVLSLISILAIFLYLDGAHRRSGWGTRVQNAAAQRNLRECDSVRTGCAAPRP